MHCLCLKCHDKLLIKICPFCREPITTGNLNNEENIPITMSEPLAPLNQPLLPISSLSLPSISDNLSRSLPEESIINISDDFEENFYRNQGRRRRRRRRNTSPIRASMVVRNAVPNTRAIDILRNESIEEVPKKSESDKIQQKFRNNRSIHNRSLLHTRHHNS